MILFSDDKVQIDSSPQLKVICLQEKDKCSGKAYLKRRVSAASSRYIIVF